MSKAIHAFLYEQHFISTLSNTRLKLAKNQANAKQHSEAEVCLCSWHYTINHNKNKDETEK